MSVNLNEVGKPLYGSLPLAVEQARPIERNPSCTRCKLNVNANEPCMTVVGEPGGLLVVSDYPGHDENSARVPFVGKSGQYMRKLVKETWAGPVAWDNAIKCLDGDTAVKLGDGSSMRLAKMVSSRYAGDVMAVDEDGALVRRRVVGWHKSPLAGRQVVKVSFEGARCGSGVSYGAWMTDDHRVLTQHGWVPACDVNDQLIATGTAAPNAIQHQVLFGTLLGDGCIPKGRRYLAVTHCAKQEEWALLKRRVLESLGVSSLAAATYDGFTQVRFKTSSQPSLSAYRTRFYASVTEGPRVIPEDLSDFGLLALATLYLDDGCLALASGRRPRAQIATCAYSLESAQRLAQAIGQVLKRDGVTARNSSGGPRIFFTVGATERLSELVAPAVPPSMQYKILAQFRGRFDEAVWPSLPAKTHWARAVVEPKSGLRNGSSTKSVYCLDVEEVHNFVTPGGVVHNCYPKDIKVQRAYVAKCRDYLRSTLLKVKPKLILACGRTAIDGLTGRSVPPMSVRRGTTVLRDGTPVYYTVNPAAAIRNRFVRAAFERDVRWALTTKRRRPFRDGVYVVVDNAQTAAMAYEDLVQHPWVSFDCETYGPMYDVNFKVTTCSVLGKSGRIVWVWDSLGLEPISGALPFLKQLMEDDRLGKVAHHFKFDAGALTSLDIETVNLHGDTVCWVRQKESVGNATLDVQSERVGLGDSKGEAQEALKKIRKSMDRQATDDQAGYTQLFGPSEPVRQYIALLSEDPSLKRANVKDAYAYGELEPDLRNRYCGRDAWATRNLALAYEPQIFETEHLRWEWEELQKPLNIALWRIERAGMAFDLDSNRLLEARLRPKVEQARHALRRHGEFDPDSNDSKAKFLFQTLGLPVLATTEKTGQPLMRAQTLEKLVDYHEVIPELLEYAKLTKMLSTYVTGLRVHVRSDGRIHPRYHASGTGTGRISGSDPNPQNFPTFGEWAKPVKNCFYAPVGYTFIEFDYGQMELRIAALLSNDKAMREILTSEDVHRATASKVLGKPASEISDDERTLTKRIVFGLLYGKTAFGLSKDLGCSLDHAEDLIDQVFGAFVQLEAWMQEQVAYTRKTGKTWTYWKGKRAHCRYLWGAGSNDEKEVRHAENGARNTPVQGSAAFYMNRALFDVSEWLEVDCVPARIVNTVHDSMKLEVRNDVIDEVLQVVPQIMRENETRGVPFVVDAKAGPRWGSLKEVAA